MIQARLADADRYATLHPLFPTAFAWLRQAPNLARPDGRLPVQGEDLIAILESGSTWPASERRFESHRRYIDIQFVISGPEVMEWMPIAGLAVADDFAPDGDIAFYHDPGRPATRLLVAPGEFAVFWPQDGHKPCCRPGTSPTPFRKCVCKVALEPARGG